MKNKTISIILFLLSILIFIGLLSNWTFNIWRYIDILIIIVNIFLGIILLKKNNFKLINFFKIFKTKKFWVLIMILFISIIIFGFLQNEIDKKRKEERKCKFILTNIVENRYEEDRDEITSQDNKANGYKPIFSGLFLTSPARHYTYWEIDGLLTNNIKKQLLNSIILKIYTNDDRNILLSEGYYDVKKILEPGQSLPFQIKADINRDDKILSKYFKKDDDVRIDVYPYYLFCSY